jgi:hypothetical protein
MVLSPPLVATNLRRDGDPKRAAMRVDVLGDLAARCRDARSVERSWRFSVRHP